MGVRNNGGAGRGGSGVKPASKSSIQITFTYRGVLCRERIRLEPTPANLKRCERHLAAVNDAIARGVFDYRATFPNSTRAAQFADLPGEVKLLGPYLEAWLARQQPLVKASTWTDYRKTVRGFLVPSFGHVALADLRLRDVKAVVSRLTAGNKRIANLLSPLRIALQEAVEDELIEANPLKGWSYQRREAPRRGDDIDPFSPEEQAAILAQLDGQGLNLVQFAFWSGLRTSELVALEWGDIDWLRGEARVSRAETQAADEPEVTKTRAGTRDVKLLPLALAALKAQKAWTLLHPSGRVFLNPRDGKPWAGDQPIRKTLWAPAVKRAGVRYRRPYQTRHTFASMMLSAGESPMWVAAQMGHADWTMIAKVYGRWIPAADPDAGGKADRLFGSLRVKRTENTEEKAR